jgi:hypothetical protein
MRLPFRREGERKQRGRLIRFVASMIWTHSVSRSRSEDESAAAESANGEALTLQRRYAGVIRA